MLANQDTVSGLTEHVYLGSRLIAQRNPNATKAYFFTDAQGSPRAAANSSGTLLWRETFKPWGGRSLQQANLGDYPLAYTGQPLDAESWLLQLGARYYHPLIGRFYAMDPVHFDEDNIHSFSRYAYANNNPYKFVDPTGLIAETGQMHPNDRTDDAHGGYHGGSYEDYASFDQDALGLLGWGFDDDMAQRAWVMNNVTDAVVPTLGGLVFGAGTGLYQDVKGHHIHSKAAFAGIPGYDHIKQGFSISQDFMDKYGLKHKDMPAYQLREYAKMRKGAIPNTMREHNRIAFNALIAGGATPSMAGALIEVENDG